MSNNRFTGPYRQSLLKLYSQCPRKFRLLEVDKVEVESEKSNPLIIGSLVHELLDDFHRVGRVRWEDHDIPTDVENVVVELVSAYIKHNRELEVLHSEIPFNLYIGNYKITGTIDLIYRNSEGQIVLRDIKTDASEPSPNFLARDIQFSTYYLGAYDGLGIKIDLLEWYQLRNLVPYKRASIKNGLKFQAGDLRGNPSFPVMRTTEDIPNIAREIKYIIQGIRFNIFPMRPLKIGHMCPCNFCDVIHCCNPHGEQVDQVVDFSGLQGYEQFF